MTCQPLSQNDTSATRHAGSAAHTSRVALWALLLGLGVAGTAAAHSVHQREMTIWLSPESIAMLAGRADGSLPGGPGLRNGDVVHLVFQSSPVPNNASRGAGAYMTLYVPSGFEVIDAGIIEDTSFIYLNSPPRPESLLPDGWGPQGENVTPAGNMAHLYADTGVFYSDDPRTAYTGPQIPNPTPSATGQLLPILGQPDPYLYNDWDLLMTQGYNGDLPSMGGRGHTPYGYGSVVAGPDTFYQNDYRLCGGAYCGNGDQAALGPWQRIRYGGAQTAAGPEATVAGDLVQYTLPASTGWVLGASNPLPAATNAVRYALGERIFGAVESVRLSLRLVDDGQLDSNGCFETFGDVFGGDAAGSQDGKDHPWRYAVPGAAAMNSCVYIYKQGPPQAAEDTTVTYTIPWANLSGTVLSNVVLTDIIDERNVTFVSSVPPPDVITLPNVEWHLGDLQPGDTGTITVDVILDGARDDFTLNNASMTSDQYPLPYASKTVTLFEAVPQVDATKSVSPGGADPGDTVTYTITLDNVGLGATPPGARIDVADTLPAGFTYVPGTTVVSAGPSCPFSSTAEPGGGNPISWQLTPASGLCAGDTMTITFDVLVGAVPQGSYANDIEWSYDDNIWGTTTSESKQLAPVSVLQPTFNDLTIAARDPNGGDLEPGDSLCYDIVARNGAVSSDATGVVLVVPMPPFAELDTASVVGDGGTTEYSESGAGGPWTYVPSSPYDGNVTHLRFSWPLIAASTSKAPGFCVRLDSPLDDNSEIIIQGELTATETGGEVFPSDDPGTATPDDPTGVVVHALPDLSLSTKQATPTAAIPGQTITYTISLADNGTNAVGATNVVVTDTIDTTSLTNVVLGPFPPGVVGVYNPPDIIWTVQVVPNGATVDLTFTADVVDPFPGGSGSISNSASSWSDQTPTPFTTPPAVVDVGLPDFASSFKEATPTTAAPGESITYTVHVTEGGTSTLGASNVVVTDTIDTSALENIVLAPFPPGVTGGYLAPVITWNIASIANGATVDLSFTADVRSDAADGSTISNSAVITSDERPDPHITPPVDVDVRISSCVAGPPPAIRLLLGARSGLAADWTWTIETTAEDGYQVYSVDRKQWLPPDGTNPRVMECATSASATDNQCSDPDAVDPANPDPLLHYQVAGGCNGTGEF